MGSEVMALRCCSEGKIGGGQSVLVESFVAMAPTRILWLTCLVGGFLIEKVFCGWREHKGWKPTPSDVYLLEEPRTSRGLEFDSMLSPGMHVYLQVRNLTDQARQFRAYLAAEFSRDRKLVPLDQFPPMPAPHADVDLPWVKGKELWVRSNGPISQNCAQMCNLTMQHAVRPLKPQISDDQDWEISSLTVGFNAYIFCRLPAESFREIDVLFDAIPVGHTLSMVVSNMQEKERVFEASLPFETLEAQPPKMMGDLITETPELT